MGTSRGKPSGTSNDMREIIDGLPNICGIECAGLLPRDTQSYVPLSRIQFDSVQSAFGLALHMHQPTIPAGGPDILAAPLISNLQDMMEHQDVGDNHNAPVFLHCYSRMSDIIRELADQGGNPRIMLDYSGNLLWGLRQMGHGEALDNLRLVTCDPRYLPYVEWLGTMWSHAVATSTPVPDIRLHVNAWRNHFAAIFGVDAARRVKGFSAPEMHLPIHPDVCYEYVKTLGECGYEWLMVQEHTIENSDGSPIRRPHFPHRLVARNSLGREVSIPVLVKTQGSDTKLVAQMQPYFEAQGLGRQEHCGKTIPPYVLQIGDGENGGVMMNEFTPKYRGEYQHIGTTGTVGLNGSEYLEFVYGMGISPEDFPPVQPVSQHRIWAVIDTYESGACDRVIDRIREKDQGFNLDRGSWTSDRSWVAGYNDVLDPINRLSATFNRKIAGIKNPCAESWYRNALLHVLLSQTSCFRYWGSGIWTDYAREICRRGMEILDSAP